VDLFWQKQAFADNLEQRRRSPTRTWVSVSSTKRLPRRFSSICASHSAWLATGISTTADKTTRGCGIWLDARAEEALHGHTLRMYSRNARTLEFPWGQIVPRKGESTVNNPNAVYLSDSYS
jgi:hypothetical protein